MKIYPIDSDNVYRIFASQMRKARVAIKKSDKATQYLAMMNKTHAIGVVGWQELSKGHIRYKTDFVNLGHRGKGVYSSLWESRKFLILDRYSPHTISAYCTEMSLPKYLKEGFVADKPPKNGIVYVKLKLNN
jgi:hypothetical protein